MSKMKVTEVSFSEFEDDEFESPSTFYIRTATNYLFLHSRDRHKCQEWVDNEYGKNKYIVRASKLTQPKGGQTAVGRINSRSRAGMRKS